MERIISARITARGQITIPAELRRKLGIKPGTKVRFVERRADVIFQPITKEYIRRVCGMLKSDASVTEELLAERRIERMKE